MVLKPEPIYAAFETLNIAPKPNATLKGDGGHALGQGRPFTQAMAHELAAAERVVLLCGRYEGIDERINEMLCDREISIGDYVLTGGELAAAVMIDAIVRLLPGVLGNPDSARFESFGAELEAEKTGAQTPKMAFPARFISPAACSITRTTHDPADFLGLGVPDVLQNGDHDAIRTWRRRMALKKTFQNRPDLLQKARLTHEDRVHLRHLARGADHGRVPCRGEIVSDEEI